MSVIVFPGQGAQYPGMGKDFFESFTESREVFKKASEVLNMDMEKTVFDSGEEELKRTVITQPAMICTELAIFEAIKEKLDIQAVAGHSVGEISALYAAGVVSLENAFRIISKRAELMDREAETSHGVMYAILALKDEDLDAALKEVVKGTVVAANYNTRGQIVVSGDQDGCDFLFSVLDTKGFRYKAVKLKVSGAWHSPFMDGAMADYAGFIDSIEFNDALIPLIMNVNGSKTLEKEKIRENVKKQIVSSVRWTDSIAKFSEFSDSLVEIGPGNVLTGLMKRFDRSFGLVNIEKTEDLEKIGG